MKCTACDGKGYQEYINDYILGVLVIDNQEMARVTRVSCDACNGTGKVQKETSDETNKDQPDTRESNLPEFRW